MANKHLIIFVKYPEKGLVKTRVGKVIGHENSVRLYRYLLNTTLQRFRLNDKYKVWVFYAPSGYHKEMIEIISDTEVPVLAQKGDDLGARMSNAFYEVFSSGAEHAAVIGSDCPELNERILGYTFERLENHGDEIVLGPARDGGYYLLGMSRCLGNIFRKVEWSTNMVLEQTTRNIKESGLNYYLLERLADVDTIEDINFDLVNRVKKEYPLFSINK